MSELRGGGAKTAQKNGEKCERIFEDAETESAIVFHVRLIWVQNEAPKGDKLKVFGWKVYINSNTFVDVKLESTIIFQVHLF